MNNSTSLQLSRWVVYGAAVSLLAACVSTSAPTHFYTLSRVSDATQVASPQPLERVTIDLRPIEVPERLKRSQIVVSSPNSARVNILETERWASALNDELHDAFAAQFHQRFQQVGSRYAANNYRVQITLDQLTIVPGADVSAEFHWRITNVFAPTDKPNAVLANCNLSARETIGSSMDSAVQGLQTIVGMVSERIVGNISEMGQQVKFLCN